MSRGAAKELEASDANTVTLKGSAKEGKLTAHDFSHLLLADFALDRADVHLSDASVHNYRLAASGFTSFFNSAAEVANHIAMARRSA